MNKTRVVSASLVWLAAAVSAAAQQPSNAPKVSPQSAYIQSMLAAPLARDVEELVVQAEVLKFAGEEDKSLALLSIAERMILNGIAKMPLGEFPATLGEAIENEQAASPPTRSWQKLALERPVAWVPRPPGSDARVIGFRNETEVPLTYFQAAFVVESKVLAYCGHEIGSPPLPPHAIGEAKCGKSESMPVPADLHARLGERPGDPPPFFRISQVSFQPGGYKVGAAKGSFGDRSEEARKVLAQVPAAELRPPGPAKPAPISREAQQNRRALGIVTLASLGAGLVLGLAVGAVFRRPWRAYAVLIALAAITGLVAFGAFLSQYTAWPWSRDLYVAIGLFIAVGSRALAASLVIAWFWTCFAVAAAIGTRLTRKA